jgi:hypothetical protein
MIGAEGKLSARLRLLKPALTALLIALFLIPPIEAAHENGRYHRQLSLSGRRIIIIG